MTDETLAACGATRVELTGPWTLRVDLDGPTPVPEQALSMAPASIAARVPGAVHDDLQRAGIIPDPFLDTNERAVAWVSRTDWVYETELPAVDLADCERADLVFDGIDTVARINLGGTELGRTRNMFRSYRFDVTDLARSGKRDLAVHIRSAYTAAEALREQVGPRPNAYPEPFNFIRKMACSYGWDWGITVPGAGIWRPVHLQTWSTARISRIRALTDHLDGEGVLRLLVEVERSERGIDAPLHLAVRIDENVVMGIDIAPGETHAEATATLPDVEPWHPRGYGEPRLYGLSCRLTDADGALLDTHEKRIGFRHLELDRTPDAAGTPFTFRLNGAAVFVKGINWIPGDVLPGRMTRKRYRDLLQRAADAGCNLIRVWGGGLYETSEFYEICDELGLLVWQDFPFACAAYPEDEPLRSEILAEARGNVARLASHPSLVLWNGNNENLWLRDVENWTSQPGGELPWGERYYLVDLPRIVAEVDPSRPYTAGSPWSGSWEHEPNDVDHQTHHSWDVWNKIDYAHYRDSAPRFVAEFGWQAPPAWRTLRDAVTDEPIDVDSPGVLQHQKAAGGMGKLARGIVTHFPPRFAQRGHADAWHYLTQLGQVRAIETGVLHWRAHWPHTAGSIIWQLNDVWPVISWSAIDWAGRAKPLYHALREIYADRVLTIEPDGAVAGDLQGGAERGRSGALVLCAINDTDERWAGEAVLRRIGDAGPALARRILSVEVAPRSVQRIHIWPELAEFDDPAAEVLVAELAGSRALYYAREPKDTEFVGAAPQVNVEQVVGGLRVTVTATSLLRDCLVQADRIHPAATCDRGFFTLLPGESTTMIIECPKPLGADVLAIPWALTWLDVVIGE